MYIGSESEQDRDIKELVHIVSNELNPWIEDKDLSQDQDMIQDQDIMDMTKDLDTINSNLLEEEKNQADVIDHEHNLNPHTLLDALDASVIAVTRTRRRWTRSRS